MSIKNNATVKRDHEAIRNGVGYYDFTHEVIEALGPDAGKLLDRLFTNTIEGLEVGRGSYTQMLNDEGIIIDDLIVYKLEDDKYWISTLYADQMLEEINKEKEGYDAEFEDLRGKWVMYAVQGPKSLEVINRFLDSDVSDLPWFSITDNSIDGVPVYIARAGFTGERGYEIYAEDKHKNDVEALLTSHGEDAGIVNTSSEAILTSLPREKGYVLMSDVDELNPLEAGFGWAIDWETDFIGKEAVAQAREAGTKRRLLGFELADSSLDDPQIEDGSEVKKDGQVVGKTTTFTYGFTLGQWIGYAIVDTGQVAKGDTVEINGHEAKIVDRMFFDKDNERLTK